jgi:hypothetical protein
MRVTSGSSPKAQGTPMPIHDWTRVDAGIFHHFRLHWILAIADVFNQRLLPRECYALAERQRMRPTVDGGGDDTTDGGMLVAEPRVRNKAETDLEFYRRKQNVVAVRHVSGDHLVAVVEIVSKGNKSGRKAFDDFVRKAAEFLSHQVHLLILDVHPTTPRDPQGIHGAIWDEVAGEEYIRPNDKLLTLVSYESGGRIRAFIEPVGIGDVLCDMPLFLEPGRYVEVPLEETYQLAFDSVPRRWQAILEPR